MKTTTLSIHLAVALIGVATRAGPVESPSGDWAELRAKSTRVDFSAERIDRAIGACRAAGLSVGETEELFRAVHLARAENLPADRVFLKIEEGLAKGASSEDVLAAANRRLECLRETDALVMTVRPRRGEQHGHLLSHACVAMESGVPKSSLKAVFERPGFRYGRLIHAVEAGENLTLAGMPDDQVLIIMNDCLDRALTGVETHRVVETLVSGLAAGRGFDELRASLWIGR